MAEKSNGKLAITIGVASSILAIITAIVYVTVYIGGIRQVNAEQTKDITYNQQRGDDHEQRMRIVEDTMREVKDSRGLLEKIWDKMQDDER